MALLLRRLGLVSLPNQDRDPGGSINRIIWCRDSAGRDLVARIRPRWMTEGRIRFGHALANRLSDGGIPLVLPLRPGEGFWLSAGELFCDVYPFVEGRPGVRHGDYHLGNLLYADTPLRVTALLDLDMAEMGPRICYLSCALALHPTHPHGMARRGSRRRRSVGGGVWRVRAGLHTIGGSAVFLATRSG